MPPVSRWVRAEAARAQRTGEAGQCPALGRERRRPADAVQPAPGRAGGGHGPHSRDHRQDLARRADPDRVALHLLYEHEHGRPLIDPKQEPLPPDPRDIAPSDLLRAKYALVPYDDAAGMAAELLDWCTAGPRPVAGRLIHGPGGLGKSRLLIHVAAKLRGQGWTAGFLDRPHTQDEAVLRQRRQAIEQLVGQVEDRGLLLVLDYAETRQDELIELAACLAGSSGNEARPVRLVLLARSAGEWWDRLSKERQEVHRVFRGRGLRPEITLLPSLPATRQRRELFEAACAAFAPTLQAQGYVPPPGGPAPERLRGIDASDDYERPLAIQIEALLWLTSATTDANLLSFPELLDNMLVLEQAHWRSLPGTVDDTAMARGLGQVTLVQGVDTRPAAEQLLLADRFDDKRTSRADVEPLFRRLRQLYGRATDGIAQLEPDLIGEHHVASADVGDAELLAGCLAWIAAQPEQDRPQRRRDLLTVLQRATHRVHGAGTVRRAEAMLDTVILRHVDIFAAELVGVMIDTPGNLAQLLDRRIDELDEDALAAIDAHLPAPVAVANGPLLHRVADRRAGLAARADRTRSMRPRCNRRSAPERARPSCRPRRHARHPPLQPGAAGGGAGGEPGGGGPLPAARRGAARRLPPRPRQQPEQSRRQTLRPGSAGGGAGGQPGGGGPRTGSWRRRGPTPSSPTSPAA